MTARTGTFLQKYHRYLVLLLIVLFLQVKGFQENKDQILAKCLAVDCDGYWHLLRVQDIHRTGSWDNEINPRGNAPYGERIHWTRAMDLVLWTGASIGSFFTDFDSSLYWWGVFVGPVFYVLSLAAIVVFGRIIVGPKYVMHLALLFLCNLLQVFVVYSVNRPDHHCLVAFVYVLYYMLFIVLLDKPGSARTAVLTGVLGALGLWCGMEFLVPVGLSVLYLGLLWLRQGERYVKANCLLALGLTAGLMITLLLDEKPSRWWVVAYDKRSVVHVSLLFFLFLFWLGEIILAKGGFVKTPGMRLVTAAGGSVCVLLPCLILFPGLIHGPMANVDPRLFPLYLRRTDEFGPLSMLSNLPMAAYCTFLVAPAFIYVAWTAYASQNSKRVLFAWLGVAIVAYSILTVWTVRWVYTLAFVSILPTTFLLMGLWDWAGAKRRPLVAIAATLALLCAPYSGLFLQRSSAKAVSRVSKGYNLKLAAMLSFLQSQESTLPGQIILADPDIGPAIMYHTSLNVVGTLSHNNSRGLLDTYHIANAGDDAAARRLIKQRGIDYLLVDERLREFVAFRPDSPSGAGDVPAEETFFGRLSLDQIPDWIVEIALPEELADTFALYRVIPGEFALEASPEGGPGADGHVESVGLFRAAIR
jgi:hypothetical protein